jgi:hypothetical protein
MAASIRFSSSSVRKGGGLEDNIVGDQFHGGVKVVGVKRRLEAARHIKDLL